MAKHMIIFHFIGVFSAHLLLNIGSALTFQGRAIGCFKAMVTDRGVSPEAYVQWPLGGLEPRGNLHTTKCPQQRRARGWTISDLKDRGHNPISSDFIVPFSIKLAILQIRHLFMCNFLHYLFILTHLSHVNIGTYTYCTYSRTMQSWWAAWLNKTC